jgi:hypothetical protein
MRRAVGERQTVHPVRPSRLTSPIRELNSPSAARLLPFRLLRFLVSGATSWRISFRLTRGRCAARLNTLNRVGYNENA